MQPAHPHAPAGDPTLAGPSPSSSLSAAPAAAAGAASPSHKSRSDADQEPPSLYPWLRGAAAEDDDDASSGSDEDESESEEESQESQDVPSYKIPAVPRVASAAATAPTPRPSAGAGAGAAMESVMQAADDDAGDEDGVVAMEDEPTDSWAGVPLGADGLPEMDYALFFDLEGSAAPARAAPASEPSANDVAMLERAEKVASSIALARDVLQDVTSRDLAPLLQRALADVMSHETRPFRYGARNNPYAVKQDLQEHVHLAFFVPSECFAGVRLGDADATQGTSHLALLAYVIYLVQKGSEMLCALHASNGNVSQRAGLVLGRMGMANSSEPVDLLLQPSSVMDVDVLEDQAEAYLEVVRSLAPESGRAAGSASEAAMPEHVLAFLEGHMARIMREAAPAPGETAGRLDAFVEELAEVLQRTAPGDTRPGSEQLLPPTRRAPVGPTEASLLGLLQSHFDRFHALGADPTETLGLRVHLVVSRVLFDAMLDFKFSLDSLMKQARGELTSHVKATVRYVTISGAMAAGGAGGEGEAAAAAAAPRGRGGRGTATVPEARPTRSLIQGMLRPMDELAQRLHNECLAALMLDAGLPVLGVEELERVASGAMPAAESARRLVAGARRPEAVFSLWNSNMQITTRLLMRARREVAASQPAGETEQGQHQRLALAFRRQLRAFARYINPRLYNPDYQAGAAAAGAPPTQLVLPMPQHVFWTGLRGWRLETFFARPLPESDPAGRRTRLYVEAAATAFMRAMEAAGHPGGAERTRRLLDALHGYGDKTQRRVGSESMAVEVTVPRDLTTGGIMESVVAMADSLPPTQRVPVALLREDMVQSLLDQVADDTRNQGFSEGIRACVRGFVSAQRRGAPARLLDGPLALGGDLTLNACLQFMRILDKECTLVSNHDVAVGVLMAMFSAQTDVYGHIISMLLVGRGETGKSFLLQQVRRLALPGTTHDWSPGTSTQAVSYVSGNFLTYTMDEMDVGNFGAAGKGDGESRAQRMKQTLSDGVAERIITEKVTTTVDEARRGRREASSYDRFRALLMMRVHKAGFCGGANGTYGMEQALLTRFVMVAISNRDVLRQDGVTVFGQRCAPGASTANGASRAVQAAVREAMDPMARECIELAHSQQAPPGGGLSKVEAVHLLHAVTGLMAHLATAKLLPQPTVAVGRALLKRALDAVRRQGLLPPALFGTRALASLDSLLLVLVRMEAALQVIHTESLPGQPLTAGDLVAGGRHLFATDTHAMLAWGIFASMLMDSLFCDVVDALKRMASQSMDPALTGNVNTEARVCPLSLHRTTGPHDAEYVILRTSTDHTVPGPELASVGEDGTPAQAQRRSDHAATLAKELAGPVLLEIEAMGFKYTQSQVVRVLTLLAQHHVEDHSTGHRRPVLTTAPYVNSTTAQVEARECVCAYMPWLATIDPLSIVVMGMQAMVGRGTATAVPVPDLRGGRTLDTWDGRSWQLVPRLFWLPFAPGSRAPQWGSVVSLEPRDRALPLNLGVEALAALDSEPSPSPGAEDGLEAPPADTEPAADTCRPADASPEDMLHRLADCYADAHSRMARLFAQFGPELRGSPVAGMEPAWFAQAPPGAVRARPEWARPFPRPTMDTVPFWQRRFDHDAFGLPHVRDDPESRAYYRDLCAQLYDDTALDSQPGPNTVPVAEDPTVVSALIHQATLGVLDPHASLPAGLTARWYRGLAAHAQAGAVPGYTPGAGLPHTCYAYPERVVDYPESVDAVRRSGPTLRTQDRRHRDDVAHAAARALRRTLRTRPAAAPPAPKRRRTTERAA